MFNKKFIKLSIIILSIITIIILITMFILLKKDNVDDYEETPEGDIIIDGNGTIINNYNEYETIKSCINSLVLYTKANNLKAIEEITEGASIFQNQEILVNDVVMLEPIHRIDNETGSVSFVSFKLYKNNANYYAIIIRDYGNKTFKIIASTEAEYKDALNQNINEKYKEYIEIQPKKFNIFKNAFVTEEETIKAYFENYIQKAIYYPEEAYNQLDEDYSKNRFGSFKNFEKYLQENRWKIESLDIYSAKDEQDFETIDEYVEYMKNYQLKDLSKYQVKRYNNYTIYTCIDDYGDYYIFKVKGAMDYTVLLDEYTVDMPEFIEKYNTSTAIEKASLNVNKFLKAIENKDYTYAYNKLDETFKENYLKTENIFKLYVSSTNWIKYEEIQSVNVEEKNGLYICIVKTKSEKAKKFVMKLEDGLDFVMSFEI